MKRHDSAKRNYQRMVYEAIENDTDLNFEVMLNEEIGKISTINKFAYRDS